MEISSAEGKIKYLASRLKCISGHKKSFLILQLCLSGIALGVFSWNLVTALKPFLVEHFRVTLHPWTHIFFHPYESNLFNYIFLCVILWIFGLAFYFFIKKDIAKTLENSIYRYHSLHFAILPAISVILLSYVYSSSLKFRVILSLVVFLLPLYFFQDYFSRITRWRPLAIGILLFLVILEPVLLVKGPAYVINEYEDIFSQTYLGEQYVNNRIFLQELQDLSLEDLFRSFVRLYNRRESKDWLRLPSLTAIFQHFENQNIHSAQFFMALDDTVEDEEDDPPPAELKSVDLERIKKFYFINRLEYIHQNMSRGQINHIGHILNPINEYQLGKPVRSIYLQYGVGNTFLIKWMMEWFGGPSIHSYYKCHVFYAIYFILFLILLWVLFKDSAYVLGALIFLCLAFFYQGYIALVLAPGILPTIHFLDCPVILLTVLFLREKKGLYLLAAGVLSLGAIILNRQFGAMLAASFFVTVLFYVFEHRERDIRRLALRWGSALLYVVCMFLVFRYAAMGATDGVLKYFLLGQFSWPAHSFTIVLTIGYLLFSYSLLIYLRDGRHWSKYIYILIFFYTQGLLVYYYWSGLANHLPMAVPFAGLQFFLVLYMAERGILVSRKYAQMAAWVKRISLLLLFIVLLSSLAKFYGEKMQFVKNFRQHLTYTWRFERANLLTTIDPAPLAESLDLIHRYSPADQPGIYILSKYDNLLPFLAKKYSRMPFFEITWHLFSAKEVQEVLERIRQDRPQILFVDSKVSDYAPDPWEKLFTGEWERRERASRLGRYGELEKIFKAVKEQYEVVAKGELISVYRRKQ